MGLFRSGKNIVFFVHVPKTAGTTIERILEEAGAKQCLFGRGGKAAFTRCSMHHIHAEAYEKLIPSNFYDYGFMLVRNPYARIHSAFRYIDQFTHLSGTLPARIFDAWLAKQLSRLKADPYLHGNHLRPQHEFESPSVQVFKLEDGLEAPLRRAFQALELPWSASLLRAENRSDRQNVSISRKTLYRFQEYYRKDFERYGYDINDVPPDIAMKPPRFHFLFPGRHRLTAA